MSTFDEGQDQEEQVQVPDYPPEAGEFDPMFGDDGGGDPEASRQTLAAQAAEADAEDEEEEQMTLELGDLPPTLTRLIPRGMAVEVVYKMQGRETKGAGGLVDPNKSSQLLVTVQPGDYKARPVREDGKVVRWKVVVELKPTFVVPADSEAGRQALAGVAAAANA